MHRGKSLDRKEPPTPLFGKKQKKSSESVCLGFPNVWTKTVAVHVKEKLELQLLQKQCARLCKF